MVRDVFWHNVSVNIVLLLFSLLARGKYVKAAHCVWFSAVLILLYFWYLNRSQRSHNCHAQQMEHVKLKKCLWGADLALPKDQIPSLKPRAPNDQCSTRQSECVFLESSVIQLPLTTLLPYSHFIHPVQNKTYQATLSLCCE